ncbi:MAG: ABC transporter ATP-binding protein [Fibromonadales bacterium]|nr:ABC transporter ATP-binding protein [Fibromonadales bacterium]
MNEKAIEIKDLHKTYRQGFWLSKKKTLFGISLEVKKGEIFGFIGPNGAGKSTTIKVLTGLLRKDSGEVLILGKDPNESKNRVNLGYLPEQPYFYDSLSGYELLKFYGGLSGLKGKLLEERISWALKLVNADADWIYRHLRTYSKGMQQRVGLAQAILHKPELLILDEPMSGLDPLGRRDVREAILTLNREGSTIFYSSHILSDVEAISNRVAMIIDGKIVHKGTIDEINKQTGRGSLEEVLAKEVSRAVD